MNNIPGLQEWVDDVEAFEEEHREIELRKQQERQHAAQGSRAPQHGASPVGGSHLSPGIVPGENTGGNTNDSMMDDFGGGGPADEMEVDGNGTNEGDSAALGASANSKTSKRPATASGQPRKKKAKQVPKVPLEFDKHVRLLNPALLLHSGAVTSTTPERYLQVDDRVAHLSGTDIANLRAWFDKLKAYSASPSFENKGSVDSRRCYGYTVMAKGELRSWEAGGITYACAHCTSNQQKGAVRVCMRLRLGVDGQQEGVGDTDRVLEVLPLAGRSLGHGAFGYWSKVP